MARAPEGENIVQVEDPDGVIWQVVVRRTGPIIAVLSVTRERPL